MLRGWVGPAIEVRALCAPGRVVGHSGRFGVFRGAPGVFRGVLESLERGLGSYCCR